MSNQIETKISPEHVLNLMELELADLQSNRLKSVGVSDSVFKSRDDDEDDGR